MREPPNTVLNSSELLDLQLVYQTVCAELEILVDDDWRREEVAATVMRLANAGERDPRAIHQRAVMLLTNR